MFTGDPVSTSKDAGMRGKGQGISSCAGSRPSRTASTTTIGSRAATAPLTLMKAVSTAVMPMVSINRRVRLLPEKRISSPPSQVVMPAASMASATTKSEAINITVPLPKPEIGFFGTDDPGAEERQRHTKRDDLHRQLVPDERGNGHGEDDQGDCAVTHGANPSGRPPIHGAFPAPGHKIRRAGARRSIRAPARRVMLLYRD